MANMTLEQKQEWAEIYTRYLTSFMNVGLASIPNKNLPSLEICMDDECYCDSKHYIIHIGIQDAPVSDETELMSWVMFRLGHEMQHALSTTQKAWDYGIEGGYKAILREYAAKHETKPVLFRKDEDYDRYLATLQKRGIHISKPALLKFVRSIVNILEDGRIERLRAIKNHHFKNLMVYWRGVEWLDAEIPQEQIEDIDSPYTRMWVILNQVLTLATMRIYQKGFPNAYAKDPSLFPYTRKLMEEIKAAVQSGRCRKCMEHGINLCKMMAEDLMEACKMTPLEAMLSELMKHMASDESFLADSRTEEDGDDFTDETMEPFVSMGFPDPDSMESEGSDSKGGKDDALDSGAPGAKGTDATGKKTDRDEKSRKQAAAEAPIQGASRRNAKEDHTRGASGQKHTKELEDMMKDMITGAREEATAEVQCIADAGAALHEKIPSPGIIRSKPDAVIRNMAAVDSAYRNPVAFQEQERDYTPDEVLALDLYSQGEQLKREIEKVLRNQKAPRLRSQKNGRLDAAFVYKIAMGQMDAFARIRQEDEFDGCAYFLLDNSGSMGNGRNSKRYHCAMACAVMEHAFGSLMPLKMVAFDAGGYDYVRHDVIKNWSETVPRNAAYNWYYHHTSGYGNKDGYSIRVATQELLARPEKAKILIVLSDGLPTDYEIGEVPEADVHAAVSEARKAGIEVAAIYFGPQHPDDVKVFREMYERNEIVTEPEHIAKELASVVKKFCFR